MPALHKASLTRRSRAKPSLALVALDLTNRHGAFSWKNCVLMHPIALYWHGALERTTQCMYTLSPNFLV